MDIETVSTVSSYDELDSRGRELWAKKTVFLQEREEKTAEELFDRAGIYAEFGKIVCISVGFVVQKQGENHVRLKSFASHDERELLVDFANLLQSHFNGPDHLLGAHNGKEFDFPYIARRMVILGVELPGLLDIAGKKPWEIKHLDTMELWKFGDYKAYTSLDLLTYVLNIPTPKDDIDGSQVANVYYKENDLDRIIQYCEKDVVATIQLVMRYKMEPLIPEEYIVST